MRLIIPTSFVPPVTEPVERVRVAPSRTAAGYATIRYRVRSGESLWVLAERYNTTVKELRSLNALGAHEKLRAGQVIRVPAPTQVEAPAPPPPGATPVAGSRTHLVRRGDTLIGIAGRYGVSLSTLREANGMRGDDIIKAGTRLTIP
jgi:LysM repeat protein